MRAVERGVQSVKKVRQKEGVVQGGDGEILGRAIRGATSVPAASLHIFPLSPWGTDLRFLQRSL